MNMNQYLACMLIGLGISNLFPVSEQRKSIQNGWSRLALRKNFAGFSFAASVLFVFLLGSLSAIAFDFVFCSIALIAEGMNVKWRDYRSSAYAAFVGTTSLLFRLWRPGTAIMLIISAGIAAGLVFGMRAFYNRLVS